LSKNAVSNAIPAAAPKTIKFEYLNIFGTFSSELFQLYTENSFEIWIKKPSKN
jgi:hypothetical protein